MTDNGVSTFMPVAPTYGNGFGGGFNDDLWLIIILLFAFGGGWGNGFGGFGGMGGFAADGAALYPWMNQSQQINDGFRDQMLNTTVNGIQNAITSGFGDVQLGIAGINQNICQSSSGITQAVANGFAQAEIANNARQIADMQQNFANQTAVTSGMNTIASNLQNCCCENRAGIADLKYTVATENCADRQAVSDGIRDILTATQQQTTAILNQLCADKLEAKNDVINQLRSELLYARGQASQDVQTAAIQAGQRGLANEIEQYVAPKAVPAYIVQNPNCCAAQTYGCGCGAY